MKTILKINTICFLCLFFHNCKKEYINDNTGKIIINKEIKDIVNEKLKDQECLAVKIFENGYCMLMGKSETSPQIHCNTMGYAYSYDGTKFAGTTKYFAFGYSDSLNKSHIALNKKGGINDNEELLLDLNLDTTYSCNYIRSFKNEKSIFFTDKSKVVLDKLNYAIGDTINGYIYYAGLESTVKIRRHVVEVYFRCINSKETDPKDYIRKYLQCDEVEKDSDYVKSRNLLTTLKVKQKEIKHK